MFGIALCSVVNGAIKLNEFFGLGIPVEVSQNGRLAAAPHFLGFMGVCEHVLDGLGDVLRFQGVDKNAAAGFTDDGKRLAGRQRETYTVHSGELRRTG